MKIDIKGTICRNDDRWAYDWCGMDATCPKDVTAKLDAAPNEAADIYINSGGGEIYSGSEIYSAIRAHKGPVNIHVTGLAASAASVIMCAGRCDIAPTAMVMIHNVSTYAAGNYIDFEHEAEVLRKASAALCAAYVAKTGKSAEEIQSLMDQEKWFTAAEAVEMGLCDAITGESTQMVAALAPVIPRAVADKLEKIKAQLDAQAAMDAAVRRFEKNGGKKMNRTEYENQRNALLEQVHEAQITKDPDRMNALMDQVEALGKKYQDAAIEAANARALAQQAQGANFYNQSRDIPGGKVVERMNINNMENHEITYTAESKEYHDGFLKRLQGKDLTEAEMKATAVVAPGTIPTETVNKIVGKMAESPMLAAINMMMIPGNISIPVEGTVNDASWVEMGTASTDSADTVDTVQLGAYKLIKTVEITANLAKMSIPAFENWLVDRLARKLRRAADNAICVGDGSNKATGLLHASDIDNTGTFASGGMKYSELMAIIALLPAEYLPEAKFAMPSKLFFSDVLGMTDTAERPIIVADPQSPAKFNILGYPVILDDNITADNLIFGDLYEGYTFNFAMAPEVKRDESIGFRTGSSVFRGMALADGKVVNKKALVKASRGG